MSDQHDAIDILQQRLGVHFEERALLTHALTHSSYVNEHPGLRDNERLEFLGDAVIDFITAELLFRRFPDLDEGMMTRFKSALVRTESLAGIARDIALDAAMLIGKGEANSGGRDRDVTLCQVFEAVIGAMYLDRGLAAVQAFIVPRLQTMEAMALDEAIHKDPRSRFQEWAQARFGLTPEYEIVSATGPEHERLFVVEVTVGPKVVTAGAGPSKQTASQAAAAAALERIDSGKIDHLFPPDDPFELDQEQ